MTLERQGNRSPARIGVNPLRLARISGISKPPQTQRYARTPSGVPQIVEFLAGAKWKDRCWAERCVNRFSWRTGPTTVHATADVRGKNRSLDGDFESGGFGGIAHQGVRERERRPIRRAADRHAEACAERGRPASTTRDSRPGSMTRRLKKPSRKTALSGDANGDRGQVASRDENRLHAVTERFEAHPLSPLAPR